MRLTILGCQAPYPGPGGACSSYLLTAGGRHVLIDCGSGALANLGRYLDPLRDELSAVVLSHLHQDHISDFWLLRYAVARAVAEGLRRPLPVYLPDSPAEIFDLLPYSGVELHPLHAGDRLTLLAAEWSFFATEHPLPCLGMRVQAAGQASLVYTGDTALFAGLADHCRDADLLLAECSLRNEDAAMRFRGHMTGGDVGRLAAEAGCKRLVLTHLWPRHDPELLRQQAAAGCACPVEAAGPHAVFNWGHSSDHI